MPGFFDYKLNITDMDFNKLINDISCYKEDIDEIKDLLNKSIERQTKLEEIVLNWLNERFLDEWIPLHDFLEKMGISLRTYYTWKSKGAFKELIKIGRKTYITRRMIKIIEREHTVKYT